jgi:hypothetical protein
VAIHNGVGEIVSADPEINDRDVIGPGSFCQFRCHFTPNPSSPKTMVPIPATARFEFKAYFGWRCEDRQIRDSPM